MIPNYPTPSHFRCIEYKHIGGHLHFYVGWMRCTLLDNNSLYVSLRDYMRIGLISKWATNSLCTPPYILANLDQIHTECLTLQCPERELLYMNVSLIHPT